MKFEVFLTRSPSRFGKPTIERQRRKIWLSIDQEKTNDLKASGEVSQTLELPFYPFVYGISFAAAAVCLVLLVDLFKSLGEVFRK